MMILINQALQWLLKGMMKVYKCYKCNAAFYATAPIYRGGPHLGRPLYYRSGLFTVQNLYI